MFKKLRFKFELYSYYLKHNFLFLLIGIVLGSLIFIYKDKIYQIALSLNLRSQSIGVEGLYTFEKLPNSIKQNYTYGLTQADKNGKYEISPIVESVDIRDDHQQYVFKLKSNLSWHNGKKLVSSDIKLDIPSTKISYPDESTITIDIQNKFSPFFSLLDKPIFLNKTAYGLGPNKIIQITYQDGFIKTIHSQNINNKRDFFYRFYPNESDLISAFRLGQVDSIQIGNIPINIKDWPKNKIQQDFSTNTYVALFFNTNKISSRQTRQALNYAIKKPIQRNERCIGPIAITSWAYNPAIKEYQYNPENSKKLFESAKVETINLIVADRKLLETADQIKNDWKSVLGVETKVSILNTPIEQSNYDAILAFGVIPTDPDQYSFWHSTQTDTNITKLNNSRIDKLLEEGRSTYDQIERKNIYFDFQRFLLEESPAIFIRYPSVYTITRTN